MSIAILIVCLLISSVIVNGIARFFMKLVGAKVMFFNPAVRFVIIFAVGLCLYGAIGG